MPNETSRMLRELAEVNEVDTILRAWSSVLEEAADEIDRLEDEVENLRYA